MYTLNSQYQSLDDRFKPIVLEILKRLAAKGWQPIVAEGKRTIEQQREKVRRGVSQTMNSYHLSGMAADIIDKRHAWNIPLSHQYWKDQGEIVLELAKTNKGLYWGGVWKVGLMQRFLDYLKGRTKYFVDVAHVELRV
jgi:hypothetical protein